MITTVTLNPCIDLTLHLENFISGGLNVVSRSRFDTCGKGVNVSVVLRALGLSTMCTGINFDGNGIRLHTFLEEQSIAHDFAVAHGNIRTNVKLVDGSKNTMTELNSLGEPVDENVVSEYLDKLFDIAHRSTVVVLSGRIPNGGYDDIYKRSLERIKKLHVITIVDTEKEPLKHALMGKPYLIKPNLYELEETFGCKVHSKKDAVDACRDIIKKGVKVVCCSMDGDGAIIVDKKQAWHAPALELDVKGFQGAGDSMVAGICKAIKEQLPIDAMLRYGVAAASASLLREGTQLCRREDFNRLLPQVAVERIKK